MLSLTASRIQRVVVATNPELTHSTAIGAELLLKFVDEYRVLDLLALFEF